MSSNNISDEGMSAIAEGLMENSTLTELFLSYNDLSENSGLQLAKSLENKANLRILGLNNCKISTEGVIAIAMAIGPHKAL